ncbi:hypothetical protein Btru_022920 [Bulinus truncatus]|nr:hypothetical protein Btru_022920 [Bulinus truncatus]
MHSSIKFFTLLLVSIFFLPSQTLPVKTLFLSPYLENGQIKEAQMDSLVDPAKFETKFPKHSHAGFITVNKTLGNHLFFWFFPVEGNVSSAPVLIWLSGGPGLSSMGGLLCENGPIQICKDFNKCNYRSRQHSWSQHFSMLYIDSPVSVGYSFTESGISGERVTQQGVSEDLYSFVEQFYSLFPDYKKTDLYVGGASYAGKYVPFLAHLIHTKTQAGLSDIPLTGIYMGGPLFDPPTQSPAFFDYIYTMGAISYQQMIDYKADVRSMIIESQNDPSKPFSLRSIIERLVPSAGFESYSNYVTNERTNFFAIYSVMTSVKMREALHVGHRLFRPFNQNLYDRFGPDVFSSAKSRLVTLLDNYKALIYSGEHDVIVSAQMVETALLSTPWSLQFEYNRTSKLVWGTEFDMSDITIPPISERNGSAMPEVMEFDLTEISRSAMSKLKGFYSLTGKFCRVTVKGAGHSTAYDQTKISLEMMIHFIQYGCIPTPLTLKKKSDAMWQTLENCYSNTV